jgi:hypothetical protein
LLFLLTDDQGRGLLIAESISKMEADTFGRNHLPEFRESIEIDEAVQADAEEFWEVRKVRLLHLLLDPYARNRKCTPTTTMSHIWVVGPQLPDDVESDGLLTQEDRRDLTLDHIARTSEVIVKFEIIKRS